MASERSNSEVPYRLYQISNRVSAASLPGRCVDQKHASRSELNTRASVLRMIPDAVSLTPCSTSQLPTSKSQPQIAETRIPKF